MKKRGDGERGISARGAANLSALDPNRVGVLDGALDLFVLGVLVLFLDLPERGERVQLR